MSNSITLDRWIRRGLGVPGWIAERTNTPPPPRLVAPDRLLAAVRRHRRWPDAHVLLEHGLEHAVWDGGVVGWRVQGGVAFGVGGFSCARGEEGALLGALRDGAAQAGASRAVLFPVRPDELASVRAARWDAVQVGVEALVDLHAMDLQSRRYRQIRQVIRRAERHVEVSVTLDPPAQELQDTYDGWLASRRPATRMGLLVGSPCLERPQGRRYVLARSTHRVEGFLTLLPGGEGVWGVDVMCRRPDAPVGVMEALIVAAARECRAEGAHTLSLGACPMADIEGGEHPRLQSLFRWLYRSEVGKQVFGFRGLRQFKAKFHPIWRPVHLASDRRIDVWTLYMGCRMWGLY